MRGQLVDAPGYMMNYAAGSIIIADIRARTRRLHGPFVSGDSGWYKWVGRASTASGWSGPPGR
jgi:hypothetical protein